MPQEELTQDQIRLLILISKFSKPARNREEEEELEFEITSNLERIKGYCNDTSQEDIHYALASWYKELTTPLKKSKSGDEVYKNESYNFRRQFFEFCKKIDFVIGGVV